MNIARALRRIQNQSNTRVFRAYLQFTQQVTFTHEKPCVTCNGTQFYKSDYHCVQCKANKSRQFRQSDKGREYYRNYMRMQRQNPNYRYQQKVNAYMREQGKTA